MLNSEISFPWSWPRSWNAWTARYKAAWMPCRATPPKLKRWIYLSGLVLRAFQFFQDVVRSLYVTVFLKLGVLKLHRSFGGLLPATEH